MDVEDGACIRVCTGSQATPMRAHARTPLHARAILADRRHELIEAEKGSENYRAALFKPAADLAAIHTMEGNASWAGSKAKLH
jgi:hypothetical protein